MQNDVASKRKNRVAAGAVRRSRPVIEKSICTEGVYANPRLTHTGTSLIGCVVQIEVKNGRVYEGIFKTFSPKMDVALEMAHMKDNASNAQNYVPSKERLLDQIVFSANDIVMITAYSVDMDYVCKDTFTDPGITRCNGQDAERKLEPWDDDSNGDEESLAGVSAGNGWDPNEMFKANEMKFNVQSKFDPSLHQYTTTLTKSDTKEYREREAKANRIAQEIERSENYQARKELENGDDLDEETQHSAVIRPAMGGGEVSSGKYVPPALRHSGHVRGSSRPSGHTTHRQPPPPSANNNNEPPVQQAQSQQQSAAPASQQQPARNSEIYTAGDEHVSEEKRSDGANHQKPTELATSSSNETADSPKSASQIDRGAKTRELMDWQTTFKLSDNESKKRKAASTTPSTSASSQLLPVSGPAKPPASASVEENAASMAPAQKASSGDVRKAEMTPRKSDVDKLAEKVKTSKLNPNAKEFVFNPNAKSFTPAPPPPIPVTARPPQSPVLVHPAQMQSPMQMAQPIYPAAASYMLPAQLAGMPTSAPMQQQPQQARFTKRAVVSVQARPDFNPAAQAAAATGQPLMAAQSNMPAAAPASQYAAVQLMHPQMGGIPHMYQQMMQVGAGGSRMIAPHVMQGAHVDQNAPQQQTPQAHMFASASQQGSAAGQMVAHTGGAMPHSLPPHVHHQQQGTPPNSQPNHGGAGGGGGAGTPAGASGSPLGPQQPPPSNTPQSHLIYQQTAQMSGPNAGGPPHTPTSPHTMYPPAITFSTQPYAYSIHPQAGPLPPHQQGMPANMPHPGAAGGGQQPPPHHYVMVPQPAPQQVSHASLQHAHQLHHMQGGPMPGGVSTANVHPPMTYLQHQMHPQPHHQPMHSYHQ